MADRLKHWPKMSTQTYKDELLSVSVSTNPATMQQYDRKFSMKKNYSKQLDQDPIGRQLAGLHVPK